MAVLGVVGHARFPFAVTQGASNVRLVRVYLGADRDTGSLGLCCLSPSSTGRMSVAMQQWSEPQAEWICSKRSNSTARSTTRNRFPTFGELFKSFGMNW
jgi:hypothetical protein